MNLTRTIAVLFLVSLLFVHKASFSQSVDFGEDAKLVKAHIDWFVKDYYSHGSGEMVMSSNIVWKNGSIMEVTIERDNVPHLHPDGRISHRSFRSRYVMVNGKLDKILKEYYNLSVEQLRSEEKQECKNVIGKYFITDDYKKFYTIFLGSSGLATVEIKPLELSTLPSSVRSIVANRIKDEKRERDKDKEKQATNITDTGKPEFDGNMIDAKSVSHNLEGRTIVVYPSKEAEFREGGRVIVRVMINREGVVTNKVIISSTTSELARIALIKVTELRFNQSPESPEQQIGSVTFNFKLSH